MENEEKIKDNLLMKVRKAIEEKNGFTHDNEKLRDSLNKNRLASEELAEVLNMHSIPGSDYARIIHGYMSFLHTIELSIIDPPNAQITGPKAPV
jgi:benzoyl-CoA reductase/2-hydroxyglutaryl-CoA dehydratase subunit BcrC/BadD/HgdB